MKIILTIVEAKELLNQHFNLSEGTKGAEVEILIPTQVLGPGWTRHDLVTVSNRIITQLRNADKRILAVKFLREVSGLELKPACEQIDNRVAVDYDQVACWNCPREQIELLITEYSKVIGCSVSEIMP